MFGNNNWYLFIRLHDVLCERLQNIHSQAQKLADEEARCKKERKESTAIALRLKAPSESRAISGGWRLRLSPGNASFWINTLIECLYTWYRLHNVPVYIV